MQKLRIEEIIRLINQEQTFEAESFDGSFQIKINRYVPYCCMAIHDGGNLRENLRDKIKLNDFERWYEEDPQTGEFISSLPITLIGMDSRFEYDLNRSPEDCIYEEAWGKKVWATKLGNKERQHSLRKHTQFYQVLHCLIEKLNAKFDSSIVYDIHSYNYKRWDREVPLFNLGTENIDQARFRPYLDHWLKELESIQLRNIENRTSENDVFKGRGYNLKYITEHFPKTLVLATEIKKVYCDEETGADFPEVISALKQTLKKAILRNAQHFIDSETNWKHRKSAYLLDKKDDQALFKLDQKLFQILKGFELLAYVNPNNVKSENKRFVKSKFQGNPVFRYGPIKVDPYQLKQRLGALPTREISDISIRTLYEHVIGSYYDKIDMLASLNTEKFLYNSLRYFGRPSAQDIKNANYLLHLPPIASEPKRAPHLSSEEAISHFKEALLDYKIDCKIELSNKVISQVMVLNSKKTILIRPDAKFNLQEIRALIEHEIGVHLVTTENSQLQRLKVFNLGLPVNTQTQEGLAILSEYLSGNISLKRLKKLALRVIIADMMCNGADFNECFKHLHQDWGIGTNDSFTITTRIFRGGGFTKDYLYLSGFVKILKLYHSDQDLSPLLIGKTSLEYYNTIQEMIARDMVSTPRYMTKSFENNQSKHFDPVYQYVISGLR